MRDSLTDERLDDLNQRVDGGFGEMHEEFRAVRTEMHGEFRSVRAEMRGEFAAVRAEMAAMHRTTMQIFLGGLAVMLAGFAGTIATILTQI